MCRLTLPQGPGPFTAALLVTGSGAQDRNEELFGHKPFGADLQVPPEQSEPAMSRVLTDNPDATVRTFPGLNHLMQPSDTGRVEEYGTLEATIDRRCSTPYAAG